MSAYQPFFSIIIPTYSRPRELLGCLEALACLRFPADSFEVLVVDDGSPAPPEPVVTRFHDRLSVRLLTAAHGGASAARNHGAERAAGKFLAFTDDDCRPAPDWLDKLQARCNSLPDHIVGGRTVNVLAENPYAATSQLIVDVIYALRNPRGAGEANFLASNNLAIAADRFRGTGGFDCNFAHAEDRELCDRWLWSGYRMTYAPEALVYHAHALSLRSFWWQHFGYGRGAWHFHRIRQRRGSGQFQFDWHFYQQLGVAPFASGGWSRKPIIAALMLIAQVANCAGFLYEGPNPKPMIPKWPETPSSATR
jgi:GT2 family glycosyltransferase